MTLFPDLGGDPRAAASRSSDVLAWFGALGDAVLGNAPGFAVRKASLARALSEIAEIGNDERNAVYFAGVLHGIGAIGNAALRKRENLSDRVARMERWDIPAQGARLCEAITVLPVDTADLVRWQSECWDGTGFPDQLRWHGIPLCAQLLGVADRYLQAGDPEEALGSIGLEAGRSFNPEAVRTFTMWFHLNGGEVTVTPAPVEALRSEPGHAAADLLADFADRIDAHNDVPGRWRRVAALARGAAAQLHLDEATMSAIEVAAQLFGAGELTTEKSEDEDFDPLARLGIEHRAAHAAVSAMFAEPHDVFKSVAPVLAARAEWFDGTGKPHGIGHNDIPIASAVLAAAIAYDHLDRGERIEGAAGTQFDPKVVRALIESAKAHA